MRQQWGHLFSARDQPRDQARKDARAEARNESDGDACAGGDGPPGAASGAMASSGTTAGIAAESEASTLELRRRVQSRARRLLQTPSVGLLLAFALVHHVPVRHRARSQRGETAKRPESMLLGLISKATLKHSLMHPLKHPLKHPEDCDACPLPPPGLDTRPLSCPAHR